MATRTWLIARDGNPFAAVQVTTGRGRQRRRVVRTKLQWPMGQDSLTRRDIAFVLRNLRNHPSFVVVSQPHAWARTLAAGLD
jgi:hypothetical protein